MQTLTMAATKGGVGKTTLSSGLAVQIAREGLKVALIDNDPQKSLEGWFKRRKNIENMALIEGVDDIEEAKILLEKEGADWLVIDTAPAMIEFLEPAIEAADFVLIPTKSGAFDLTAIDPVVELCQQHRKKFAFIINMAISKKNKMVKGAAEYLSQDGQVLDTVIENRAAYMQASLTGHSAPEIETTGKSKEEMASLWLAVKKLSKRMTKIEG